MRTILRAISKVTWNDEKGHALQGFMQIVLANPGAMEQSLLEFFSLMASAESNFITGPSGKQCRESFKQVRDCNDEIEGNANYMTQIIQQYKSMISDFDSFLNALPSDQQARFRELYSV